MYAFSTLAPRGSGRFVIGLLLVFALFFGSVGTLLAGTTSTISGTVTDARTKLPIHGVTVAAVAQTGTYKGTTDANGFYSFTGVYPDTYTISFQFAGYQPYTLTGVTALVDQITTASAQLQRSLVTIGRVTITRRKSICSEGR